MVILTWHLTWAETGIKCGQCSRRTKSKSGNPLLFGMGIYNLMPVKNGLPVKYKSNQYFFVILKLIVFLHSAFEGWVLKSRINH